MSEYEKLPSRLPSPIRLKKEVRPETTSVKKVSEESSFPRIDKERSIPTTERAFEVKPIIESMSSNKVGIEFFAKEEDKPPYTNVASSDDEKNLISEGKIYDAIPLPYYKRNVGYYDMKKVGSLLKERLYDPSVLKTMLHIINSVIRFSDTDMSDNFIIRQWISNFEKNKKIGDNFYSADFDKVKELLLVKIAKATNTSVHEAVIGLYGTNKLRDRNPSFCYVYGAFFCSDMFHDGDKVLTYCVNFSPESNKDPQIKSTTYIIYENSSPLFTLKQALANRSISENQFRSIYSYLMNILYDAKKQIQFTHYNLDCDNVMLCKKENINIQINNRDYKLRYLPQIFNFEDSHIIHKDKHYGSPKENLAKGVLKDKPYFLHDAFKLAVSCFVSSKDENIKNVCRDILSFFLSNTSDDNIYNINNISDGFLPYDEVFCNEIKEEEFISYIFNIYKEVPSNETTFGCQDGKCDDENELIMAASKDKASLVGVEMEISKTTQEGKAILDEKLNPQRMELYKEAIQIFTVLYNDILSLTIELQRYPDYDKLIRVGYNTIIDTRGYEYKLMVYNLINIQARISDYIGHRIKYIKYLSPKEKELIPINNGYKIITKILADVVIPRSEQVKSDIAKIERIQSLDLQDERFKWYTTELLKYKNFFS